MDFLRNGGQSVDNRDFTVCIIRCVYRANSQVSAASCKLVPLGRPTFWMLKLVNFARVPSLSMGTVGH